MTFEKNLRRLDEIMAALEGEQVGLDASLKLFEEGIELLRSASAELDKAETKVQMLLEKSEGGFELREMDLYKVPGVAETLDWTRALAQLGATRIDTSLVDVTLGARCKLENGAMLFAGARLEDDVFVGVKSSSLAHELGLNRATGKRIRRRRRIGHARRHNLYRRHSSPAR